ncbi:MAG: hypothetical protein ABIN99_00900 [Nitrosospira sp.]
MLGNTPTTLDASAFGLLINTFDAQANRRSRNTVCRKRIW